MDKEKLKITFNDLEKQIIQIATHLAPQPHESGHVKNKYSCECLSISGRVFASAILGMPLKEESLDSVKQKPSLWEELKSKHKNLEMLVKESNFFALSAWHFRAKFLNDGRSSEIESNPTSFIEALQSISLTNEFLNKDGMKLFKKYHSDSMAEYHNALLHVYFDVFGRLHTFNDRAFEIASKINANTNDKGSWHIFIVKFSSSNSEPLYECDTNENYGRTFVCHRFSIPSDLEHLLIGETRSRDLRIDFLLPSDENVYMAESIEESKKLWLRYLKSRNWKFELGEALCSAWHKMIAENHSFQRWKDMLKFLDVFNHLDFDKESWDQSFRDKLKEALQFIQAISMYRPFAEKYLITLVCPSLKGSNDILGAVTVGLTNNKQENIDIDTVLPFLTTSIADSLVERSINNII